MPITLSAEEAQSRWLHLLEQVQREDVEVVVTQDGVPVARLTSVRTSRAPGMDAGKVWMAPDFDAPLPDDLLDAFEGQ
ncbi:MAG: type II toxin-antitoxin system Phd/YefM family antitoxin [Rhodothermales bacterium]